MPPEAWSAELERALLLELMRAYEALNYERFRWQLRSPVFGLCDNEHILGRYDASTRLLELSRRFVQTASWGEVLEVLKHEMAHQAVIEVYRVEEPPHGPVFRAICKELGIDAAARGLPRPSAEAAGHGKLLDRVKKLLALAESDNRHEAEAAAALAQKLLLKHNLELPREGRQTTFRHIGRVTGRVQEWERRLACLLRDHFFVDVIWVYAYVPREGRRGSVLEAVGAPESLELASYVYDFMVGAAERCWLVHKAQHGIRGNGPRLAFVAGVMSGFAEKLRKQSEQSRAEGLVWVPSDDLQATMHRRHPRVRTTRSRGHSDRQAFAQGKAAGQEVVLHRGLRQESEGGAPRALPSG